MAGKARIKREREERRRKKRQRKQSMRDEYARRMKEGRNTKSKRFRLNTKKKQKVRLKHADHPDGRCGNPACRKCHTVGFDRFMKNGKPHHMPQWMWYIFSGRTPGVPASQPTPG